MQWLKYETGIFLLKVVGVFLCWYVIYDLWLLPDGQLDEWVTTNTAAGAAGLLDLFGYDVYITGRLFGIGESPGIYLVDGCSGIEVMGLFVGFIIAYPGGWLPRTAFIVIGTGVIYLINILRNVVLALSQVFWPAFFDITHDYTTTAIFYLVVFGLWVIWVIFGETVKFGELQKEIG